ncbi:hypothetical protein, partial [Mycobacterium senriense]|uniref:hypothetical protein n=1 Tax=Mycobacterium senriense TaxID=2775496 RepID=UPI0039EE1919
MSTTLDTLWSLHGSGGSPRMADAIEFVARRGGRSRHFFFFGGGGGSAWLAAPILFIAGVGGYLMRNPDKARGLKERVTGAWKAGANNLAAYRDPNSPHPAWQHPSPPLHPGATSTPSPSAVT